MRKSSSCAFDDHGVRGRQVLLNDRTALILTVVSMLAWCGSLPLPAVDMGPVTATGWQFLIDGWRGIPAHSLGGLSWLANPLLIATWWVLLADRGRALGLILSCCALVAALSSFLFNLSVPGEGGLRIERFAIGFYFWLVSPGVQVLACLERRRHTGAQRSR